jgi:prophage tail gpP-like protein
VSGAASASSYNNNNNSNIDSVVPDVVDPRGTPIRMRVEDILDSKPKSNITINQDCTVDEAITHLAKNKLR